jgi:peptide/nickel transport system ATP-binding protein
MPLLDVVNLTVLDARRPRWRRFAEEAPRLVDAVTFSVEAGTTTAIAGEDGSGTLALAFALVGIVPTMGGDIRFDGNSLAGLREGRWRPYRRQMQVLFSETFGALPPHQTIGRMLLAARKFAGPPGDRSAVVADVEGAMEKARLPLATRDYRPGDLDPTIRQRAALARALLFRPRLLICHDFTRGLDAPAQASLLNRLRDLREEMGFGLLVMTHDLAVADHLADRIHVMLRGRFVESSTPNELLANPSHEYTRRLITAATLSADGMA